MVACPGRVPARQATAASHQKSWAAPDGSKNCAILRLRLAGQRIARLYRPSVQDACGGILADRGTVFEAMPRASSHQPYIVELRMAVDQEIAVGRVLVLAHARLHQ